MNRLFFVAQYTSWHYTKGTRELFRNWMDFLWFLTEFFSLGILVKTLFSPWERMDEKYTSGFHPSEMMQTFILNTLMRVLGFFIRLIVLCIGSISLVVAILGGTVLMMCWFAYPIIIFFFFALAVRYLFI